MQTLSKDSHINEMCNAMLNSRPLKRSLCERKIRTFAFSIHSFPLKETTV